MRHFFRYILILVCALASLQHAYGQSDRQYIRSGNRYYRQQNYAKAEAEYRKALAKNGQNPQALYNLGCALMQQQKDSAAIVQYENAGKVETSPLRRASIFHNIGVVCQSHQMFAEAIEAYKESLRNNPANNETRYNLALCKRQQKKQQQNGGAKQNDKNKKDKDKDNDKKQNKNKQDKQQKQNQQQNQPKEQMSKDNAEQLLNAAMQQEKATQQRLKKAMQQPRAKRLQKNW